MVSIEQGRNPGAVAAPGAEASAVAGRRHLDWLPGMPWRSRGRQRSVVRHGCVVGSRPAFGTNLLEDPALIPGALSGSLRRCHICPFKRQNNPDIENPNRSGERARLCSHPYAQRRQTGISGIGGLSRPLQEYQSLRGLFFRTAYSHTHYIRGADPLQATSASVSPRRSPSSPDVEWTRRCVQTQPTAFVD